MKTYNIITAVIIGLLALAGDICSAQERGAERLTSRRIVTNTVSITTNISHVVNGQSTINSNLKSRGFVGPYEIVAHRERGLFGPSTVETFLFDTRNGEIAVINPSSSPGVGIAAVNGGALVGASYLFGHSIRPDQNTISSGSSSNGGSNNNASTANGNGGSATAGSTSNGGNSTANGNGGSATAGSTSNGGPGGVNVNVNNGAANGNGTITLGHN